MQISPYSLYLFILINQDRIFYTLNKIKVIQYFCTNRIIG
jgi:hypothetical protein